MSEDQFRAVASVAVIVFIIFLMIETSRNRRSIDRLSLNLERFEGLVLQHRKSQA